MYIPFNWPKFQAQTHGWNSEQKWSYWVACCAYYWQGCVGIDNDEETMKIVCEVHDSSRWGIIRARLFQGGGYFFLENGKWHQDYARQEWKYAADLMKKRAEQTEQGRIAALEKAAEKRAIKSVTESITRPVTEPVSKSDSSCVIEPSPSPSPSPDLNTPEAVPTAPAGAVAEPAPPPKDPSAAKIKAGKEFRWREGVLTLWLARYKSDHGGTEYQPTAGDKGHLATFSKTAAMPASDFVAMAARAWKYPNKGKFSHCQNAHSISYVCRYYNQIVEELKNEISTQFNKRNIGVPGDAAARAKATADFVARQQREHEEVNREPV